MMKINSANNNQYRQQSSFIPFKANPAIEIIRRGETESKKYSWVAKKLAQPMAKLINTRFSMFLSEQIGKMKNSISHLSALVSVSISSFYVFGAMTNDKIPDERRGYLITNSALGGIAGIALSYLIDFLFVKPLDETERTRKNLLKPLMPNIKQGEKFNLNIDLRDIASKFGISADKLLFYMGFDIKNYNPSEPITIKEVFEKLGNNAEKDFVNGAKRFVESQKDGARKFKSLLVFTPIVRFIAPLAAIPLAAFIYNKIKPYNGPLEKASKVQHISMNDCIQLASKNHTISHA